jgi:lysozyme
MALSRTSIAALAALLASCGGLSPDAETEAGLTVCPGATTLEGVDVSRWDTTVDWAAVKSAGISFAIARISDGLHYPDAYFDSNYAAIKSHGLVRGSYQYFEPAQDPVAQANMVLQRVGTLGAGDLAPAIDVETMGGLGAAAVNAAVGTWLDKVHGATGRRPIVYSSPSFWSGLGNPVVAADLWVAHWGVSCPSIPTVWSGWKFWQYSATGTVAGINRQVDRNRFNGSWSELLAYADGAADAGVPDAGTPDAGAPDAGGPNPIALSSAGCASGGLGGAWVAAVLALSARRRRRANPASASRSVPSAPRGSAGHSSAPHRS